MDESAGDWSELGAADMLNYKIHQFGTCWERAEVLAVTNTDVKSSQLLTWLRSDTSVVSRMPLLLEPAMIAHKHLCQPHGHWEGWVQLCPVIPEREAIHCC